MEEIQIPQKMRRSPNLVCLCIDKYENEQLQGRLFHYYNKEELVFCDVIQVQKEMEGLFDELDYPQANTRHRAFKHCEAGYEKHGYDRANRCRDFDELTGNKGDIATFIVDVTARYNTSWQGNIFWIEKSALGTFQSDIELLKLLEVAVE